MINELSSSNTKHRTINELKCNGVTLNSPECKGNIKSTESISEAFNKHFTTIGPKLAKSIPSASISPELYIERFNKKFKLSHANCSIVQDLLTKLSLRKGTGLDDIPCKLLQMSAEVIAPSLTSIFNRSITAEYFPTEWKLAKVSQVFKSGKRNDENNFRPISVIPAVGKICEKIVFDQLYKFLNANDLLTHSIVL